MTDHTALEARFVTFLKDGLAIYGLTYDTEKLIVAMHQVRAEALEACERLAHHNIADKTDLAEVLKAIRSLAQAPAPQRETATSLEGWRNVPITAGMLADIQADFEHRPFSVSELIERVAKAKL